MRNREIICIAPVEWNWGWQRYHEIMRRLARVGNRVLVLEHLSRPAPAFPSSLASVGRMAGKGWRAFRQLSVGPREVEPGVTVLPALSVGHGRLSALTKPLWLAALRRAVREAGDPRPVLWFGFPTPWWAAIVDAVRPRLVVYDCASAFAADPNLPEAVAQAEASLLQRADLVFTDSHHLCEYHARVHPRCYWVATGVDFARFSANGRSASIWTHPVIGYTGTLHAWVDFDLIHQVAQAHPEWTFVFVGPRRERARLDAVMRLPNVRLHEPVAHDLLPEIVRQFDVAWIPYRVTEFTRYVFPTKLMEYLAAGRPVVSTDLPELRRFAPPVRIGRSAEEIGRELASALVAEDRAGREIARRFDWPVAMAQIHDHLDRALGKEKTR